MSLRINLNSAALTAHRQLSGSDSAVSKSIERLSSGYKINSAGDDPAGLVISEKLRAQIGGINQAIKNAGDAVNMVKTAEGALQEVNRLLGNMRTLAVHAANTGVNDTASLTADQDQIASSIVSINKIASETQFGGKKLLDGSAGIVTSIKGTAVLSADMSKATLTGNVNNVHVEVTTAATKAQIMGPLPFIGADLHLQSFTINNVTIKGGVNAAATLQNINDVVNQTGVVATTDEGGLRLVLTQQNFGSAGRIDVTGGAEIYGLDEVHIAGVNAVAKVTSNGTTGYISDTSWTSGQGTLIKDTLGNAIQLTDAAAGFVADNADQIDIAVGTMSFQVGAFAGQTRSMNISSVNTSALGLAATGGGTTTSLALLDVNTKAQEAINVLDKAIADVSSMRASLGSAQKNTFESAVNSLKIAGENIAASESTIRDTDMAAEMVEFTKNQILMQAGTAMLAQANQAPQNLLKLLQ